MLNIMVTCGAGFSSSTLVTHLNKEAKEKGLDDRAYFFYCPFDFGFGKDTVGSSIDDADVVFLCPHLQHNSKMLAKQFPDTPFYVIPTRLYGLMAAEEYIEDAEDVVAGFKETGMNPFHFEGEERAISNLRTVSHRKYIQEKKK